MFRLELAALEAEVQAREVEAAALAAVVDVTTGRPIGEPDRRRPATGPARPTATRSQAGGEDRRRADRPAAGYAPAVPDRLPSPGPSFLREQELRVGDSVLHAGMGRPTTGPDDWWLAVLWVT